MFKIELVDFIRSDYRELKDLAIKIEGSQLEGSLYNLLTPYLAHKNTLDSNNRIISFYTREGSRQQKLMPFYIGLSNYYKTFSQLKSNFSESKLNTTEIEYQLKSITNKLPSTFTYIGKSWSLMELALNIEKNNKIHVFIKSIEKRPKTIAPEIHNLIPNLKSFIEDYETLKNDILIAQKSIDEFLEENDDFIKFKEIRDASNSNIGINEILKLGNRLDVEPTAGVLLFTNKTKYKKLIENTLINEKPITETFSIAEVKVTTSGALELVFSGEGKPILYFCSLDYYAGWQDIVQELDVNYINTIVIDDFDSIVQKETRVDFEFFKSFASSIRNAQEENIIKDVYFLDEDYNFLNSKLLSNHGLHPYPWLLNYQERSSLNGKDIIEPCHKALSIKDELGASFWEEFKKLILHLNLFAKNETSFDRKAQILSLLSTGYILLSRVTSFYDPVDLKSKLNDYVKDLYGLNVELESASFKDKIDNLSEVVRNCHYSISKISIIIDLIKDGLVGKSLIVSKNLNDIDKHKASNLLHNAVPSHEVTFTSLEELNSTNTKIFDNVFFLHYSGKYTRSLFLSKYCKNQFIILNNRSELGFYKKCFYAYSPDIIDLSDFDNKLILLNLEDQESLIERNKIEYDIERYLNIVEPEDESEIEDQEEISTFQTDEIDGQEFSFVIENVLTSQKSPIEQDNPDNEIPEYLIFFENSFIKVPAHKHFYILNEEEALGSKDFKKKVSELRIGENVFLLEGFNDDFNELLSFLKNEHRELKLHLDAANSWRRDLQVQYEIEGGFYTRLNKFLASKGIVVTDPTVEKWVSGITIMPESLIDIVKLFQQNPDSFSSKFSLHQIVNSTKWLARFRTALHKEIFQYHIFKRYGMFEEINKLNLKSLIEKMDDIVSIRKVIMIEKK